MALGEQSLGLCSTCNNQAVCTRRKGIKFPVLFCEEFEDSTALDMANRPVLIVEEKQAPCDTALGLCCNCRNRDSCALRDSPGGVWHCEEYC